MIHHPSRWVGAPVLLALAVFGAAASCGGDGPTGPAPVSRIIVTPATVTAIAGQSTTLAAQVLDVAGTVLVGRTLSWSSSDTSVATVAAGIVSAKKPGTATVAVASGNIQGTAVVTVTPVPVANVSVVPTPDTIVVGRTVQLIAAAGDAAGIALAGRVATWSSSDTTIATVSASGLVTGRAVGAATITATVEGKSGAAQVLVLVPVAFVQVTPSNAVLTVGGTQQFVATARDTIGNIVAGRKVFWQSGNPLSVTVSSSGLGTAVAVGSAGIIATVEGTRGIVVVSVVGSSAALVPFLRRPFNGEYLTLNIMDHDRVPSNGVVVPSWGESSIWGYEGHNGFHFGLTIGTPVLATADGQMQYVVFDPGCTTSRIVSIDHLASDGGRYMALAECPAASGQVLIDTAGDKSRDDGVGTRPPSTRWSSAARAISRTSAR